jgi:uncharacterized protein YutE (UPF0331/DUF86 family)
MTNVILMLAKLTTLREHVDRMERRRPPDLDILRDDVDRQDALALSLLVALQEAADIALHIASDEGWGVASSYAESFDLLGRRHVIAPELARRMTAIAALRNRIGTIDVERLWRETPTGIEALRGFAAAIAEYLRPREEPRKGTSPTETTGDVLRVVSDTMPATTGLSQTMSGPARYRVCARSVRRFPGGKRSIA